MRLFRRKKNQEVAVKEVVVEKQYSDEFKENYKEFLEYWCSRIDANPGRSITISKSMVNKLSAILIEIIV